MFFETAPIRFEPKTIKQKSVSVADLKRIVYPKLNRNFVTDPFELPVFSDVVVDVECFRNYFLIGFKHVATGLYFYAEMKRGQEFPVDVVKRAMWHFRTIGFNSKPYDLHMIEAALDGMTTDELKAKSDEIIIENKRTYLRVPYNHIDLIEVAPLEGSLKLYAARLHGVRIQDMPIDVHADVPEELIEDVREYNFNDLDCTYLLYSEPTWGLLPHIQLRERLGKEIGEDLRSKSDAQVAEAFINARLKEITGRYPKTPVFDDDFEFRYKAPPCVQYTTPQLQRMLELVHSTPFHLDAGGSPILPRELASLKINIGGCEYRMGIGGLHSSEKSVAFKADEDTLLIDRDVASYYPWIIINNSLFPEHLGHPFLQVYKDDLVLRRLELKRIKDALEAGLKIAINGTFGKLGSVYSTIYSPHLMIQVTITGQLCLLMLIEMIEEAGIPCVSANTDGVVIKCPKDRYADLEAIVKVWEERTSFVTEETRYSGLYCRDVNNYIAVKEDGSTKTKGVYSERGSALNSPLSKNPETLICSDAVQAFLTKAKPIEETIRECADVRRFVAVKNVRGGAHKDGFFLGKVVRWYYAVNETGTIKYVMSGNTVGRSEGGKPLMEMHGMPHDIDYEFYFRRSEGMLKELGVYATATRQVSMI